MRRRRRAPKEIAFSFDSFLDLVANVVGIILRLILVAWVGARTYKAVVPPPPSPPPALAEPETLPEPTDPRLGQLAKRREDLSRQRDVARRRDAEERAAEEAARRLRLDLEALTAREAGLRAEEQAVQKAASDRNESAKLVSMSLEELQRRGKQLDDEVEKLRKQPFARKELRYRTPVSAPVTEEVMFECKDGRVSLIDTAAMLAEVRRELRAKSEQLRGQWQVTDLTAPVGAFQLRYVIERERGLLAGPGGAPLGGAFRYGLSGWEVVPVAPVRGETAEQALAAGSAFRKLIDALDAQQTAVTLWVYPDSFPLYRALRDYLHDRDMVVAGRPLPDGAPIASSRHGTISRGQ
jgi:hypothetical protein